MRHDLSDPTLIAETAASQVWRVKLSDGQSAVLKLLLKDHDEESRGTAYLSDLAGRGAVVVLYRDADMVLMEHCPGPSTGDLVRAGREEEATEALCAVIRTIHAASPDIAGLQPLAARFQPLTSARLEGDLADAARTACKLLAEPVPAIALHGDLHHDNVLLSPRGWLAIDPKGVWGDPSYECANAFRNPDGIGARLFDISRINWLADHFSHRLGFATGRLLDWAAAHCALSTRWSLESGLPVADDLRLLPLLLAAAEQTRREAPNPI